MTPSSTSLGLEMSLSIRVRFILAVHSHGAALPSLSGLPPNKLNAMWILFLRDTSSGWNEALDFSLFPAWDSWGNSSSWEAAVSEVW